MIAAVMTLETASAKHLAVYNHAKCYETEAIADNLKIHFGSDLPPYSIAIRTTEFVDSEDAMQSQSTPSSTTQLSTPQMHFSFMTVSDL
jgi:hypothetical protein